MIEEISNIKESIFMKYTDKMKDLYIKKIMITVIVCLKLLMNMV